MGSPESLRVHALAHRDVTDGVHLLEWSLDRADVHGEGRRTRHEAIAGWLSNLEENINNEDWVDELPWGLMALYVEDWSVWYQDDGDGGVKLLGVRSLAPVGWKHTYDGLRTEAEEAAYIQRKHDARATEAWYQETLADSRSDNPVIEKETP